jgi:tight adherence protein C
LSVLLLSWFAGSFLVYHLLPSRDEVEATRQAALTPEFGEKPLIFKVSRLPLEIMIPLFGQWGSAAYRTRVEGHLERGGLADAISVPELVAMKFWLAALFGLLMTMYSLPLVFVLMIAGFGFFFPDLWLRDRARSRGAEIVKALPFALDLMALLVQAGLDFTAAVAQSTAKLQPGPLREELDRMLKEFRLGSSRVEALQHLSERAKVREMTTLCTALIQASELGSSIGPTLRQQSEIMRTQRFQEAERRGGVASQQMVIPLVMFIMPAVFIMVLGPAVVRYIYGG